MKVPIKSRQIGLQQALSNSIWIIYKNIMSQIKPIHNPQEQLMLFIWQLTQKSKGGMLFCIWNMDYLSPEENSLIYQSNIWLLKPCIICHQTIKSQHSSLKTSQYCYYIPLIGWQDWIMKIKCEWKRRYKRWWKQFTQRWHQKRWKIEYRITM